METIKSESEGSSDDDDEDMRDMEGKTYTTAGEEVMLFFARQRIQFPWLRCSHEPEWTERLLISFAQIDRASAGNVKRSKEEMDADPEKENQFGYTQSKH